jgi:hypothetical protein
MCRRRVGRSAPHSTQQSVSAGCLAARNKPLRRDRYAPDVKAFATGRLAQAAGKYGGHAPMAAVCCNACRTCVQTNVMGLALAGLVGFAAGTRRVVRRVAK